MARSRRERSLTAQLRMMLDMAGADPKRWIVGTVAASLVLAALDTLGVAAMVPLTQLITGDTDSWFVEWLSQRARHDRAVHAHPRRGRVHHDRVHRQEHRRDRVPVVAARAHHPDLGAVVGRARAPICARAVCRPPVSSHQRGVPEHQRRDGPVLERAARRGEHHLRRTGARGDHRGARDHVARGHALRRRPVRRAGVRRAVAAASPAVPRRRGARRSRARGLAVPPAGAGRLPRGSAHVECERVHRRVPARRG